MKILVSVFRAVVVVAMASLWSLSAHAHAILLTSSPSIDGTAASGHVAIHIKYNSRIDHHRSRLTLTGPAAARTVLTIDPTSPVDEIDSAADLAPGQYSLRWQVLAVDGHITRGDIPFTVTAK